MTPYHFGIGDFAPVDNSGKAVHRSEGGTLHPQRLSHIHTDYKLHVDSF